MQVNRKKTIYLQFMQLDDKIKASNCELGST